MGVLERGQAGHSPAMLCDDNLPLFLYVVQECGEILTRFAYAGSSHGRIVPHVALTCLSVGRREDHQESGLIELRLTTPGLSASKTWRCRSRKSRKANAQELMIWK